MLDDVNRYLTAFATVLVAVASFCRLCFDIKRTKSEGERAKQVEKAIQQVEKAIQDVRQSIRRSAAWICLAITLLVLAILAQG